MSDLTPAEVLKLLPQRAPMRFMDEILELDETHIVSEYTWTELDCEGHFPGNPVVPGVKLIEMARQTGNVAWGIFLMGAGASPERLARLQAAFTRVDRASFKLMVRPGDALICAARFGKSGYFRDDALVAETELRFRGGPKDAETAFTAVISVQWTPDAMESPT